MPRRWARQASGGWGGSVMSSLKPIGKAVTLLLQDSGPGSWPEQPTSGHKWGHFLSGRPCVLSAVAGAWSMGPIESCKWIASWHPNNYGVMDPVAPKLEHVSESLWGYITVRLLGPTQDFWFRSSRPVLGHQNQHFQQIFPGEGTAAGPCSETHGSISNIRKNSTSTKWRRSFRTSQLTRCVWPTATAPLV